MCPLMFFAFFFQVRRQLWRGPRRVRSSPPVSGRFPTPTTRFRGEIVRPDFFHHQAGRCFCDKRTFSKRTKSVENRSKSQNFEFFHLDHHVTLSATLERVAADAGALLRFLGGSRPLLRDSGEKSGVLTCFRHAAGRCFCDTRTFSK